MKKLLSLILITAVCVGVCTEATTGAADKREIFYYGDYGYMLEDGQAIIVACSGGQCGPSWDDEEDGFDRPGLDDASARFPQSADADGAWRYVVPATLEGYPVVGVASLSEGVTGNIILPEGITTIGGYAFYNCGLIAVTVPASVTVIGDYAFTDHSYATFRVTEGSYAEQYAQENGIPYTYDMDFTVFQGGCWLYTLADGVATICGYERFHEYDDDGNNITVPIDLAFPDQLDGYPVAPVKYLPLRWFSVNRLDSVIIPASVTEITGTPFPDAYSPHNSDIARFIVAPGNPTYEAVNGVLFDRQRSALIAFPGGTEDNCTFPEGSYAIPDGVTAIGDGAFYRCCDLTSVTIPDSVVSIGNGTFSGCGLTSVTIPNGVTHIGDEAFSWCGSLTSVTLSEGVTHIGDGAFSSCSDLTDVTIPEGVTHIGDEAFYRCTGLKSIAIPVSMTHIGSAAFSVCALTSVTLQEGLTSIGDEAFGWCNSLASMTIPASVTSIGKDAFVQYGGSITLIVVEGSYAEQYAQENGILYTYTVETAEE